MAQILRSGRTERPLYDCFMRLRHRIKNTKRADPLGIIGAPQFRQRLPDVLGPSELLARLVPATPTSPCTSATDRSTAAARRLSRRGRWSDTNLSLSRA